MNSSFSYKLKLLFKFIDIGTHSYYQLTRNEAYDISSIQFIPEPHHQRFKECSDCFQVFLERVLGRFSPGHSHVRTSSQRGPRASARLQSLTSSAHGQGSPTQVRRRACERCPWPPMPHHGAPSQCSDAGGRTMPHARALPAYLGIGHQTVRPGSLSQPTKMSQENTGCPKTVTFKMLLKPKNPNQNGVLRSQIFPWTGAHDPSQSLLMSMLLFNPFYYLERRGLSSKTNPSPQ